MGGFIEVLPCLPPRWTYTEANTSRWRHLFDDFIGGTTALEVPLEGNGKSLCSLRIRISDALLKRRIRYTATDSALRIHLKRPHS